MLPPAPATLPGRDVERAELGDRMRAPGCLALVGPPGIGKSTLAAAVLADLAASPSPPPVAALSLAGCVSRADTLRALGAALGALPWGDERSVADRLRQLGRAWIVADDVGDASSHAPLPGDPTSGAPSSSAPASEADEVFDTLGRLAATLPGLGVLLLCEAVPVGLVHPPVSLGLGPLPVDLVERLHPHADPLALSGNPLLAELSTTLPGPFATLRDRVRAEAGPLARWTTGVPGAPARPSLLHEPDPTRTTVRRGVRALLATVHPSVPTLPARWPRPADPDLAASVRLALGALAPWLPLAVGAHLDRLPAPADLLLLRQVAAVAEPAAAARCLATAARLCVVAGQVDEARALLRTWHEGTGAENALIEWADGDALLAAGDVEAALSHWRAAAERLRRAGDRVTRATLLRRSADRLAARHEVHAAEPLYRQARTAYRGLHAEGGVASTLRGAADLSFASGEFVSGATLHEEAAILVDDLPRTAEAGLRGEECNLALTQVTLCLARGELPRAERLLESLHPAAEERLLAASVRRRTADLLVRRGDAPGAAEAAMEAATGYGALGEAVAQAAALRLAGDAYATHGRLPEAFRAWRQALELQIGAQDLGGLARTLRHVALGELLRGRPEAAERRRAQERAVRGALGEGEGGGAPPT